MLPWLTGNKRDLVLPEEPCLRIVAVPFLIRVPGLPPPCVTTIVWPGPESVPVGTVRVFTTVEFITLLELFPEMDDADDLAEERISCGLCCLGCLMNCTLCCGCVVGCWDDGDDNEDDDEHWVVIFVMGCCCAVEDVVDVVGEDDWTIISEVAGIRTTDGTGEDLTCVSVLRQMPKKYMNIQYTYTI